MSIIEQIKVYDSNGGELTNFDYSKVKSNLISINLSKYVNGIYLVKIIDSNGNSYTSKIVKSN